MTPKALITFLISFLALSLYAQDTEEIFQKGNSLNSEGKFHEALIQVNLSMSIDSSSYQRYLFRAEIKGELGLIQSAIEDVTKCIDRCDHKKTRNSHHSYYYLARAKLQLLNNNQILGVSDASENTLLAFKKQQLYNFRNGILTQSDNIIRSLTDLNKSISLDYNQVYAFIIRGEIRTRLGDLKGACNDLTQAVDWGFDEYESWVRKNCKPQ